MKTLKTIEMNCGQAYVVSFGEEKHLLELGDVFLPNENELGTRPYRYSDFGAVSDANKRVLTICTMSGCCGSCTFCSVRNSFKRNLTAGEILAQVDFLLDAGAKYNRAASPLESKEFHVLYSRMGEPSLNMDNVIESIEMLSQSYPHVKIGLSTLAWAQGMKKLLAAPQIASHIMLQFSAHATDERTRSKLLGVQTGAQFFSLQQMANFTKEFRKLNPRKVSLNFIPLKGYTYNFRNLRDLFSTDDIYIRLSPLNVTENSDSANMEGLLKEEDVLSKSATSSSELKSLIANLEQSGFSYAYAPAIDEEISHKAACGQALEALKRNSLLTFASSHSKVKAAHNIEHPESRDLA